MSRNVLFASGANNWFFKIYTNTAPLTKTIGRIYLPFNYSFRIQRARSRNSARTGSKERLTALLLFAIEALHLAKANAHALAQANLFGQGQVTLKGDIECQLLYAKAAFIGAHVYAVQVEA